MVNNVSKAQRFDKFLSGFQPEFEPISRGLALYSAAIALADDKVLSKAVAKASELGAEHDSIYEVMLQSYLFLGFPRMLTAAESFRLSFPDYEVKAVMPEPDDILTWKERGTNLCRKVYAENFEKLKSKVISFTPDIYDWMILEGYGKVLSRPALDIKIRELAVVSCLIMEKRTKQLHSHIKGTLNVGVKKKLLTAVISDLRDIDEDGHSIASSLMM